ncbi:hypothetical protein [Streptomyces sp. NPDC050856]|uniref:hypothetical protein n=1 Tax=Streptomyces sp. NPDC050856 TaxID=3154939 RepID=UPI0033F2A170
MKGWVRSCSAVATRLPVIGGHVGIVAHADAARALPDPQVGDRLEAFPSTGTPNP